MTRRTDKKNDLRNAWGLVTRADWPFEPEVEFHPERRWRFDWASDRLRLAVEVEGVTHDPRKAGRHQRAKGYEGDCAKYNAAIESGWIVLRYSPGMIDRDPCGVVEQVQRVLALRERSLYGARGGAPGRKTNGG